MTHKDIFLNEPGFILSSIAMGSAGSFSSMVKAVMETFYALFTFPWKRKNFDLAKLFKALLELIASFTISYYIIQLFRKGYRYAEGIQTRMLQQNTVQTTETDKSS